MPGKDSSIDFEFLWKKIHTKHTEEEEKSFSEWLEDDKKHEAFFQKVQYYYQKAEVHNARKLDVGQAWESLEPKLSIGRKRKSPAWIKIAAAIAATIALIFSVYFLLENKLSSPQVTQSQDVMIPPGTSKARLILDDGKTIDLSCGEVFEKEIDGTIVTSHGTQIAYHEKSRKRIKKIRYNTLEIPRAAEYFIVLSDSTSVWLNSDSKLRYPVSFAGDERIVELAGEAYFEVSQDKSRPFKVITEEEVVEVLGTEFNISSYPNEELIYTTLVKGQIQVYRGENPELSLILQPGFQTFYSREEGIISKREVDVYEHTAWKDGVFCLKNKPLEDMMKTLTRWYDIDIVFENEAKKNMQFTGDLERYDNFEEILIKLEKTHQMKFEIRDTVLVVI